MRNVRADNYWRPDTRAVMCPTCGVSPGDPCVTVLMGARGHGVQRMPDVHLARRKLIDEQLRRR